MRIIFLRDPHPECERLATLPAAPSEVKPYRDSAFPEPPDWPWGHNSPPGCDIAYPQIHQCAGGTGTYSDPITFATDQDELAPGTIVYYSYLHRYFIMEDDCVECDQDWNNGKAHIDLWIGGEGGDSNAVINCEDALTQDSADVDVNPPSDEQVDTTPLFDSSTNTCYDPGSFGPQHSRS